MWSLVQSAARGKPQAVYQGVCTGPSIFINDRCYGTEYTLSKFADDAKVGGAPDGCAAFQSHMDSLGNWEETTLTTFNKGKSQVLQLGRDKPIWLCMLGLDH